MEKVFFTKGIYGSGMVLQRERTNCIFGKTAKKTEVKLNFRDIEKTTVSDENGDWKIEYNPGTAGGPFKMELRSGISAGIEVIHFDDVYVGEVWVSSGQSNAQLPMERLFYKYKDEFRLPENPMVRMITIPISYSFDGEKDSIENPSWICASPENLRLMSGTAYFFAKKLSNELKVPVGIVNASQGGSPIQSWMSEDSLKELNKTEFLEKINLWRQEGKIQEVKEAVAAAQSKWDTELFTEDKGNSESWEKIPYSETSSGKWETCTIPGDLPDFGQNAGVLWLKKEIQLTKSEADELNSKKTHLWMGTIQDADKIWVNGEFCGVTYYTYPPRRYIVPEGAFVEGSNTVTIRIQKNGAGPIRFYKEKPYWIFTDDVEVQPSVTRNIEKWSGAEKESGVKISLSGEWKKLPSCEKVPRPGELFFEWEPTALYNSMLSPAFNYAVSGALWYQGESNAAFYNEYKEMLVKMAGLWREKFAYAPKNMPFVVAQLPNWADGHEKAYADSGLQDWAELRQAQRSAVEELENAGLAVLIDAGEWNDLHPESKKTVGTRAALEALRLGYGYEYGSYPKVEYCQKDKNKIAIRFNCGNRKLKAYPLNNGIADMNAGSVKNASVAGFELLCEDSTLLVANAKLVSDFDVEVEVPEKNYQVKELRYLWKNNPWEVNLYSDEGIPAAPFKVILE